MFLLFFEQILLTYIGLLSTNGLTIPIMKTTSKYFLLTKILCSAIIYISSYELKKKKMVPREKGQVHEKPKSLSIVPKYWIIGVP